jgi:uncharacterized protein
VIQLLLIALFGTLIGVSLGSVGAGGSILAVPVLVYVAGESPKLATVSSLVVVCVTAIMALRPHWSVGRVRRDIAIPFGVVGIAGSLLGKSLSERLNANVLMLAFSGVMVAAAVVTARRNRSMAAAKSVIAAIEHRADPLPVNEFAAEFEPEFTHSALLAEDGPATAGVAVLIQTEAATVPANRLRVVGAGLMVGLMTGFFGVGGGFVIVPALVLLLGLAMTEAVGTSLLIIAINSAVAFGMKAKGVHLDWPVVGMFSFAAVVGATVGGRVSRRFDSATLSRWFVRMVICVAIYTATRSVTALIV